MFVADSLEGSLGCTQDTIDTLKTISTKEYHFAIARHLSLNKGCAKAYCDDCFSVLSRARSCRHLEVLESVYMYIHVH